MRYSRSNVNASVYCCFCLCSVSMLLLLLLPLSVPAALAQTGTGSGSGNNKVIQPELRPQSHHQPSGANSYQPATNTMAGMDAPSQHHQPQQQQQQHLKDGTASSYQAKQRQTQPQYPQHQHPSPQSSSVTTGGAHPHERSRQALAAASDSSSLQPVSASRGQQQYQHSSSSSSTTSSSSSSQPSSPSSSSSGRSVETRNSYAVLSQAMSQAVHHEFDFLFLISGTYGSGSAATADGGGAVGAGACTIDDIDCLAHHDQLGMEAIRSLHRQLDDDDNGDIDLSESDDFLREELKYDSGYEKRHKAFHFNDDMHISVKELWEAWLRSEVHNWTVDQTTEWLAQSVQLPQYVHLFRLHKVTGKVLPRLAVNNMHYVSNVLGIKDPIHKQKIALKAMDAVLFGPPRETGTRWKDLLLVTLLLTAIIGSWYAYNQNKNAKIHIRRMAKDVEGLLKAEVALKEMQKELEQARLEQENVGKEKMDLERRLREAPTLTSSSSDLELQQLKQEIEMLRSELSRAEVEINDHCWTPPQGLQSWLQLTYELEHKHHIRKRVMAEKQLEQAREACEKLKKKRSSLVGAFVSTHGKSIDDVDRSIVEARNALNDVTNDLQERMHRWKQIESLLGFTIVNNSGIAHLENLLYNRNGVAGKSYRSRLSSSQDDLDDDSVQGYYEGISRGGRDDSSASDEGDRERDTVTFILGGCPSTSNLQMSALNTLNTGIVSPNTAASYCGSGSGTGTPVTAVPGSSSFGNAGIPLPSSASNAISSSSSSNSGATVHPGYPTTPSHPLGLHAGHGSSGALTQYMSSGPPTMRDSYVADSLFQMARSHSADMVALESAKVSVPAPASTISSPATFAVTGYGGPGSVGLGNAATTPPSSHQYEHQEQQYLLQQQPQLQHQQLHDGKIVLQAKEFLLAQQQQQQQQQLLQVRSRGSGDGLVATCSSTNTTQGGQPTDDAGSTDSSIFDEDVKRRRRKLHFPFGKRFSKSKKQ
ncbi:stromal interaction molecule homolog isoform X3 [Anopheles darlingi]|uniref:stromal interaction molecule homolog isoform X3 n=1 Tax=Anopheles darlingi TaxID=43151 RepID=UPI0021005756|nr:stromal interaction molecule homolog isoform X3 [Anopheles darlingi]